MKNPAWIWLLFLTVLASSCRTDFDTVPSTGNLEFSKDTVYLDTIFSNIGSSTYNLKVYNPSKEDIKIPRIALSQGETSSYRLNVDGVSGRTFSNIEIPARDSIFVFIETTVDISALGENQFLYTDVIEFDSGEHLQQVPLVTLVRNAVFLFPRKFEDGSIEILELGTDENGEEIVIRGFQLEDDELHFTGEIPYVIYGYAAVPEGKQLKIDAGARIHFHDDSGLIVPSGASLQALGGYSEDHILLEKEIIFEGHRLEPRFSEVPGQWGTIWLRAGSFQNRLEHVTIKNAGIGLLVEGRADLSSPSLSIKNTQIYNSSSTGLLTRRAHLTAENLVINNSGQASLHISFGGSYSFKQSTFANYWNQGQRQYPAVLIENFLQTSDNVEVAPLKMANFSNCILYGNLSQELMLFADTSAEFEFSFQDCLIKFFDPEGRFSELPLLDFTNTLHYQNISLNTDPQFRDPQKNHLQLTETSAARNTGNKATALEVPSRSP